MEPAAAHIHKPPVRKAFGMDLPAVEILDVGAMPEGEDRYAGLLAQELAHVIGFEPNPAQLAKLQEQGIPGKKYLPYFLGKGGPATFHVTRYHGCSSLYPPDSEIIDLFMTIGTISEDDNFRVVHSVPVETRRLDDVPNLPPCDYLKIDVQGGELDVLEGGKQVLAHVAVLEVEAEFIALYKNQPLFCDLQNFLRGQDFLLHKLIDAGGRAFRPVKFGDNEFAPVSQLMWADAIFVRDFSKLVRWTDDQLLKAAMILYDLYCSHDLAIRLLAERDRRHGTATAAHLLQTLQTLDRVPVQFLTLKAHM